MQFGAPPPTGGGLIFLFSPWGAPQRLLKGHPGGENMRAGVGLNDEPNRRSSAGHQNRKNMEPRIQIGEIPERSALFELGTILVSEAALGWLETETLELCLHRHRHGDWGDAPSDIQDDNPAEVCGQGCVTSAYWCAGELVVINTFISRSVSLIFLHQNDEVKATIEITPFTIHRH
jgi:hypothetical protein